MYSDKNKERALELLKNGEEIAKIVIETSIPKSTIYRWKQEMPESHAIIKKNIFIGELINKFQDEERVDENQSTGTMGKITRLIDESFKISPNNLHTLGYAIRVAKLKKDLPEAIRLSKVMLELEPNNVTAMKELEELQEMQDVEECCQKAIEREEFITKYNDLKNTRNTEELEALLRDRALEYPNHLVLQNQLASVLLDKLSKNRNNQDLILEIKNILLKLNKLQPKNLKVKSNMIKLNKLCGDKQGMEAVLRELIKMDSENYIAKSQLAQLLIDKCKRESQNESQESNLNEAASFAEKVLKEYPDNSYALGQLIEIARLRRDLIAQETWLRHCIELSPDNLQLKTNLAGALIEQCIRRTPYGEKISKDDPQLIEAKQILLKIFESQPKNLYVITYLIRIADLQSHIIEKRDLLKLKISIDPNDTRAQEKLNKIEEKIRLKGNKKYNSAEVEEKIPMGQIPDDYFNQSLAQSTISNDTKKQVNNESFIILCRNLMAALDNGWDRKSVAEILNQMLNDGSIGDGDKKKIRSMIEKTKSSKEKMRFAIREQAITLTKRFY